MATGTGIGEAPPPAETRDAGSGEWARGWPIVLSGMVGVLCVNSSLGVLGVVMQPLQKAFGWSRAEISAALLVDCLLLTVFSPLAGLVMQRIGTRRVALVGLVVFFAAFAGVSLAGPAAWSWYLVWAIVGIVTPAAGPVVWTMGIGERFRANRGLALALVGAGSGISIFLSPLIASALLPLVGWRGVFRCIAALYLLVSWPLVFFLFKPEPVAPGGIATVPPAALIGYGTAAALGSLRFWCLLLAAALLGFSVGGITVHMLPIMRDAGVPLWRAAEYLSLIGPASIVGNLVAGRLLDRAPAGLVATGCFAAPAVACVILLNYDGSALRSVTAAVLLGAASGVESNVLAFLVARYFGLRAYGIVFGLVLGIFSFCCGLGPVLGGIVFDRTGSYHSILLAWLAALLLSAVLAQCLGRPPAFEREPLPAR